MNGFVFLLLSSWLAAAPSDPDRLLVTSSGERLAGRVAALDSNWNVTLEANGQSKTFAVGDWIVWGRRRDAAQRPLLVFTDGSLLAIEGWQLSASQISVPAGVTGIWQAAKLSRDPVRGLLLHPPTSARERDRLLHHILSRRAPQDELLLGNEDSLHGVLQPTTAPDNGPPDEPPARLKVKTKASEVEVATERVHAIALHSLLENSEPIKRPHGLLGLRDGSTLFVRQIEQRGGNVRLTLTCGAELTTDAQSLWDAVACIQYFGPQVTYVSDLVPLGYKHIPFLSGDWSYATDKAVSGGRLRAAGRLFTKGIGMHSTSRLAFELPGSFKTLQGELAIDEQAGQRGSVIFRVFVDRGTGQWQTAYESSVVRGGAEPVLLNIDITNASRLALIVDFADRGDELDHANWLNLRLTK